MKLEDKILKVLSTADQPLTSAAISNRIAIRMIRSPKSSIMKRLSARMRPRTLALLVRPPSKRVYGSLIELQHKGHITSHYNGPHVPSRRYFEIASTS